MFNIPAVLLVGGMGTRLRSVLPSTPKPLAPMGEMSFLELLVRQLQSQGIRHLVMCTGFLGDQIESEFGDGGKWGVRIEYSREDLPLGTAGAVKLAERHLRQTSDFFVMNGDSFLDVDFNELVQLHHDRHALATIAGLHVTDAGRYGTLQVAEDGRVTGFIEKTALSAPGLINAGVYIFDRAILDYMPEGPGSLERDIFPRVLPQRIYALERRGMFIDIGIPEDLARAQTLSEELCEAAFRR
jgi:D-glycero-alpha-D-manno-heptose 1-phosphate guanylyltransferase